MFENAKWIIHPQNKLYEPVRFNTEFSFIKPIKRATLNITALGCYYAMINGERVGDFILAPGFTSHKRVQYQSYDVTSMVKEGNNEIEVIISEGWYKGKINFGVDMGGPEKKKALIAELTVTLSDGEKIVIPTSEKWCAKKDKLRMAELYDGEIVDMLFEDKGVNAIVLDHDKKMIVKQQGEFVKEQEAIKPIAIFKAPNGDTIVDFGQNLTGYFEFETMAQAGDKVEFTVCEELDKYGNFYNENYRDAKARFEYICHNGYNKYKPILAFWGFRYIRVDSFPCEITKENIRAIVVHSQMKRTGYLESSDPLLNKLFSNIIWGQRGNFLDIPTDCPQRDERQGWTGDATVFCKTASYNYNVEKFFEKWLTDLRLDQGKKGNIPNIIPQTVCWDWSTTDKTGAVWGDSATIIPYQMYLTYGNTDILKKQFSCMKKYIGYIEKNTTTKYLWTGCDQFGDWLGLDSPEGSYRGSTNEDFIASVFYAHSVGIVVKVGKILNKNVDYYEKLHYNILRKVKETFKEYKTQTECVLALYFDIAENKSAIAKQLAEMIKENGNRLKTGFVGTPYLLYALSQNGYSEVAYDLLLQEKFPSWLFSVKQGATTIWEHWDGKNEKGEFWSKDMNSFNHYAYGSVGGWVYEEACGIHVVEEKPGFEEVVISPIPTDKIDYLSATIETKYGKIQSKWYHENGKIHYFVTTPVKSTIIIDGNRHIVEKGTYTF
ncbi:MAG: family 78 glycoside hydrolase catalytic domain [Clostridia bacterium]|nr:family 78 glycoside hydrolase catalytic domain [Clostridia bacterium]